VECLPQGPCTIQCKTLNKKMPVYPAIWSLESSINSHMPPSSMNFVPRLEICGTYAGMWKGRTGTQASAQHLHARRCAKYCGNQFFRMRVRSNLSSQGVSPLLKPGQACAVVHFFDRPTVWRWYHFFVRQLHWAPVLQQGGSKRSHFTVRFESVY